MQRSRLIIISFFIIIIIISQIVFAQVLVRQRPALERQNKERSAELFAAYERYYEERMQRTEALKRELQRKIEQREAIDPGLMREVQELKQEVLEVEVEYTTMCREAREMGLWDEAFKERVRIYKRDEMQRQASPVERPMTQEQVESQERAETANNQALVIMRRQMTDVTSTWKSRLQDVSPETWGRFNEYLKGANRDLLIRLEEAIDYISSRSSEGIRNEVQRAFVEACATMFTTNGNGTHPLNVVTHLKHLDLAGLSEAVKIRRLGRLFRVIKNAHLLTMSERAINESLTYAENFKVEFRVLMEELKAIALEDRLLTEAERETLRDEIIERIRKREERLEICGLSAAAPV
ncbi:MAG: hypothetical protein ABIA04_08345 [Pseudomonadota bacterium]